jgi:C4-dicarboxylate transporter, DctQ subunit
VPVKSNDTGASFLGLKEMIMRQRLTIKVFANRMILITGGVAGLALAILTYAVNYEIFARYIFNSPTVWAMELSNICGVYLLFMGIPYALNKKGHINVEIIIKYLPEKVQVVLELLTNTVGIIVAVILAIEGWDLFYDAYEFSLHSGDLIRIPLIIPYFPLFWGCLWLIIQFAMDAFENVRCLIRGGRVS